MGAIHGEQWPAGGGTRDSADGATAALLRDSRRAAGLTQQQLAAAAGVSVGALRDLADLDLLSAHPAVTGLARRHAEIVTDFAETAIEVGTPGRVLPYLWALAERNPLDERAHGWLMLALAGTGGAALTTVNDASGGGFFALLPSRTVL